MVILVVGAVGATCFFGFEFVKKNRDSASARRNNPIAVQAEPVPDKTAEKAKEGDNGGESAVGSIE
jgi:hypothetical protein